MDPCYFQDDNVRCHVSRANMQWYADNNVRRLDWPTQSSELNPIEHLWDELDRRVRARQARQKSIAQLMEWLQEEWRRTPVDVLQTLVESMPDRVAAVIAARVSYWWGLCYSGMRTCSYLAALRSTVCPSTRIWRDLAEEHSLLEPRRVASWWRAAGIRGAGGLKAGVKKELLPSPRVPAGHSDKGLGEPRGWVSPRRNGAQEEAFSQVGIVPDDITDQRVFLRISRFLRPSIPALIHTHLTSPSAHKTSLGFKEGTRAGRSKGEKRTKGGEEYGWVGVAGVRRVDRPALPARLQGNGAKRKLDPTKHGADKRASRRPGSAKMASSLRPPKTPSVAFHSGRAVRALEKREIPKKIRRPAASSGTIPTCENPEAAPPIIEPGSAKWEACSRIHHHGPAPTYRNAVLQSAPVVNQTQCPSPEPCAANQRIGALTSTESPRNLIFMCSPILGRSTETRLHSGQMSRAKDEDEDFIYPPWSPPRDDQGNWRRSMGGPDKESAKERKVWKEDTRGEGEKKRACKRSRRHCSSRHAANELLSSLPPSPFTGILPGPRAASLNSFLAHCLFKHPLPPPPGEDTGALGDRTVNMADTLCGRLRPMSPLGRRRLPPATFARAFPGVTPPKQTLNTLRHEISCCTENLGFDMSACLSSESPHVFSSQPFPPEADIKLRCYKMHVGNGLSPQSSYIITLQGGEPIFLAGK
ncbi:hypothetical protein PR048_018458 [Dryococelus australis]|uniref:Tc1-like transposase DDE domain-containing protein n=1 Tax=Dryococelus australis TaxID=614101 RepID=A0ABQ9HCA3_9NEOP|nr:hypothetical protein PR048_018458 [Dryococelus australis]